MRLPKRPGSRKSLLLVERGERSKGVEGLQDRLGGRDGLAEVRTAVHNAMSNPGHGPRQSRLHPPQQIRCRVSAPVHPRGLSQDNSVRVQAQDPSARAVGLDPAPQHRCESAPGGLERAEFDRGRAGVDSEDGRHPGDDP